MRNIGQRLAVGAMGVACLLLTACTTSDTGLTPDTGSPDAAGAAPQLVVCTRGNCCAIISGAVNCVGDTERYGVPPDGGNFVGIESNYRYYCAWRNDGSPRTCWGEDEPTADALLLSFSSESFVDMRFGGNTGGIEITEDRHMAVWGSDFYGQISGAPDLMAEYVAVEGGLGWFAAVDVEGQLSVWGIEPDEGGDATADDRIPFDAPTWLALKSLDYGTGDVLCGVSIADELFCWGGGEEHLDALQGLEVQGVAPSGGYTCAHLPGGLLACAGELIPEFEVVPADALAPPTVPVLDVGCAHRLCAAIVATAEGGLLVGWGEGQAS